MTTVQQIGRGRRPAGRATTALLLGALAVAAAACKKPEPTPTPERTQSAASSRAPVAVRFSKIETRRLPGTLELSGTLDADERSEVAAQAPGAVLKVNVDVGSRVKKGEPMVELDARDASLRVAAANAQAAQQLARLGIKPGEKLDVEKVADVRAAREARDLAKSEAERAQKLFASGGVTQQQLDQAKSAAERAEAQLDATKNGVEQAWAGLAAAQAQARLSQKGAEDMAIRAPFDGAVAEKRIAPGEYAQPGRVVVVVVRDNPLRLRVDVPETDVGAIVIGHEVEISVSAFPGRTFRGTLKRIGASMKVQSRSLPVEAEVPNEKGELRPGFFARASIALTEGATDALLVPRAAIGQSGSSARVFVRAGDRVVERLVATGREFDGLVEIRSAALKAGDEVAITAVGDLTDGAAVAVAP